MEASIADLLGDNLPEGLIHKHCIEIGNVYRIPLDRKDGLTVSHKNEILSKYFIVIGIDADGIIFGGLLISSEPPKHIPQSIMMYQYQVKATKNPFLNWNSWVNCTKIFKSTSEKLTKNNFIGCLDEESLYYIISAILDEDNPIISNKERNMFNIQLPENEDYFDR